MRALIASLVLAGLGAATALPAAAHPAEPVALASLTAGPTGLLWILVGLIAAGPALVRLARSHGIRRAGAIVAVVELLAVGVETGPHLVHHVLDPDQGARCAVLQATQHGDGVVPAPAEIVAPAPRACTIENAAVPAPPVRERRHGNRSPPA